MEIEWKSEKVPPYLSRQVGEWPGIRIHRAACNAGPHARTHKHISRSERCDRGQPDDGKDLGERRQRVATKGESGNLCITPAGQAISAVWNKPLDNMLIALDPSLVNRTAAENGFADGFEFGEVYKHSDPLIQHLGLTLLSEADSATPSGRLFSDSLIQTLTLHLLTHYGTSAPMPQSVTGGLSGYKLRRVKEFINENLEEDLGLAEISAVADLSQFHFARAFRKSTGFTPQQFLMQQRIERAKELLSKKDLPIVEVSLRTGFKNQSHFTSLFRKFTSLTPKVWRESFQ